MYSRNSFYKNCVSFYVNCFYDPLPILWHHKQTKLSFLLQSLLKVIEFTILNALILELKTKRRIFEYLELKVYSDPDKFYCRSQFGQYDRENRDPSKPGKTTNYGKLEHIKGQTLNRTKCPEVKRFL